LRKYFHLLKYPHNFCFLLSLSTLLVKALDKQNTSIQKLISNFNNYFPLNGKECDELTQRFTERKIKRRQFSLQQGDVCRHFSFVVHGCLKMYAIDKKGKEHNIQFAAENDWVADLSSFYAEMPSQLYIEAVEPTTLCRLNMLIFYTYIRTITNSTIISG